MPIEPEYVDFPASTALVKSATCTHQQLGDAISDLFTALYQANPEAEMVDAPRIYYTGWRDNDCDVEAAFIVDPSTVPGPGVEKKEYQAVSAIGLSYKGNYEGLFQVWEQLWDYVKANNVVVGTECWDSYVVPPEPTPDDAVTEIYIALKPE